jgi:hypothetical protein
MVMIILMSSHILFLIPSDATPINYSTNFPSNRDLSRLASLVVS